MDAIPALLAIASLGFVVINIVSFAAFGIDKRLAEARERRIPEATLLQLAFFGGSIGAYTGRHVFRHKTRKKSFTDALFNVVIIQMLLIGAAIGWFWMG